MGKRSSGLFLGLIAGTALGILFAPKKGKKLREDIQKERDEGGLGLDSMKDGYIEMGKEIVAGAKELYATDEVQEGIGRAKEIAEDAMEEGKMHVRRISAQAKKEADKVAKKAKRKVRSTAKKATTKAKRTVKRAKSRIANK